MEGQGAGGSRAFRASWRSGQTWYAATLGLTGLVLLVAGVLMWQRAGVVLLAMGLPVCWLAWWFVRPLVKRLPVLQLGPDGVRGHLFKGVIPWQDIEGIERQQVQGQDMLALTLVEGAPSIKATRSMMSAGRKRNIVLTWLPTADRTAAADAVLHALARHGSERSRQVAQAAQATALAHEAFERRLLEQTPSLWALYAVMALNVGVWLANLADGMSPTAPATADLFRWGASSASAVVRDGEWWRLITATVLHGGLMHLALNMYALWVAGTQVTRWFGNGQFLLIYWGSALAGSALSLHFSAQQAVSVGASGAVFGVLGALLAGVWQHRERVPASLRRQLLTSQGLFVGLSLVQGFTRPGIDNAAHIGGLLAGAAMAWLLIEVVDEQAGAGLRRQRQGMAGALVAAAVAALVWAAPAGLDHRALLAEQSAMREVLPGFQQAEQALQADARALQEKRLEPAQWLAALEQRHIPAYRAVGEQFARLPASALTGRLADLRRLQAGMLALLELEVAQAQGRVDEAEAQARSERLTQELQAIAQRLQPAPAN